MHHSHGETLKLPQRHLAPFRPETPPRAAVANVLHENFYENVLPPDEIAENLDDVQALLSKLKPLLDAT